MTNTERNERTFIIETFNDVNDYLTDENDTITEIGKPITDIIGIVIGLNEMNDTENLIIGIRNFLSEIERTNEKIIRSLTKRNN